MKKILFYASVACILATFSACSSEDKNPVPGTPGAIQGANANVCPDLTVQLTIGAVEHATSYQWYKDGTAIANATANNYTVTATGTYAVAGVNAEGEGPKSANHVVTITTCPQKPGTPGVIQGTNANVCPAETVQLTIGAVTGATSYQWYKDNTAIANATANNYTVTETGTYQVAGVNTLGEGDKSANHVVTITVCDPLPDPAGTISGANANVCPGKTVQLTIGTITGATAYEWRKNGAAISGATTDSYEVTAPGTYTVAGVNAAGTGTPSPGHAVTILYCSGENIFEDVESHENWATNPLGIWTYYYNPEVVWMSELWEFPDEETPGWRVWNPSLMTVAASTVTPAIQAFPPHSGDKFFAIGNPRNESMVDGWIVSPELSFSSTFTISFYARSLNSTYIESFKVGYSTTGNNKTDFTTFVTPTPNQATTASFLEYSYTIPANAKYVAIQCVSEDKFFFFVDDIFIGTGRSPAPASKVVQNAIVDDWAKRAVKKVKEGNLFSK